MYFTIGQNKKFYNSKLKYDHKTLRTIEPKGGVHNKQLKTVQVEESNVLTISFNYLSVRIKLFTQVQSCPSLIVIVRIIFKTWQYIRIESNYQPHDYKSCALTN